MPDGLTLIFFPDLCVSLLYIYKVVLELTNVMFVNCSSWYSCSTGLILVSVKMYSTHSKYG